MKHKIEYTEGCIVTGCTVDDANLSSYKKDYKLKILNHLINNYITECTIDDMIMDICRDYGKIEFEGHCEECGDNIFKYTIEVDV